MRKIFDIHDIDRLYPCEQFIFHRDDKLFLIPIISYFPSICARTSDKEFLFNNIRFGKDFNVLDAILLNNYIDHLINKLIFKDISKLLFILNDLLLKLMNSENDAISISKANSVSNIYDMIDYIELHRKDLLPDNESVLTGSSPIVPYNHKYGKPVFIKRSEFVTRKSINLTDVLSDFSILKENESSQLESLLISIVSRFSSRLNPNIISINSFNAFQKYLNNYKYNIENNINQFDSLSYLLNLLIYKYSSGNRKDINAFVDIIIDGDSFMNYSSSELMALMESIVDGNPSINTLMSASKIMDDNMNKMYKKYDVEPKSVKSYPFEKLRNFIKTSNKYIYSNNLASLFLTQNKSIDHYIMSIEKIPVAEINDKYLVAPVIDYSRSNKPTLLIMDRNGKIRVENATLDISSLI